jgi:Fic family protein
MPARLSPLPEIAIDKALFDLSSEASFKLGQLDGMGRKLPNTELFLSIFVRQEALLSSQIEGTQCTLEEVLNFPIQPQKENEEVKTVINYVEAMQVGLAKLRELPLSKRLLCEIHAVLLKGARGERKTPGQVRKSQNWIGGPSPADAHFVPPPVDEMENAFTDLEKFLHVITGINPLIQIAIAHAQFETIHPFQDGNGRLGRLLITLFLCERQLLAQPLLYLSHFLKGNQLEYYKRLDAIREDGDWEGWIKFFLEGVIKVSNQAIRNAEALTALTAAHKQSLVSANASSLSLKLLDYLCKQPTVTIGMVEAELDCAYATAKTTIKELEDLDLLKETTGFKRNKRYEYAPYMDFWRKAQDDFSSITPSLISRERMLKAIDQLRQQQASASISILAGEEQWNVKVDEVEICKIDQWVYEKLMEPMRNYQKEPKEKKHLLEKQFLNDLADLLERVLKFGPDPEFDPEKQYEIRAVGKAAIAKVTRDGEMLKFEFLGGDAPGMMSSAREFPIPWQFEFLSDEGKHKQTKIAKVIQCGMSNGVLWMSVLPTKSIDEAVQPQVEKSVDERLATHYVIIDGTSGPVKLRPLTFYHNIFEMAYSVRGLPSWHASEDKIQSMKEALDRLNTLGRFEIFAYPDELDRFLEAVPEELKKQAKEMVGI